MSGSSATIASRPGRRKAWSPLLDPAVAQWASLPASTPSSGKWATWKELRTGNHIVQPDTDRQPAAGNAANGVPIATFNGSNVLTYPITAANNSTRFWALIMRVKPTANLSTRQRILHIGFSAASPKVIVDLVSNTLEVTFYNSTTTGKQLVCAAALTANVYQSMRVQWNGDGANDAAKAKAFVNGVDQGGTITDVGSPGTMTDLTAPSVGNTILIGASNDSDTPSTALQSGFVIGAHIYILSAASGNVQRLIDYQAAA